MRVCPAQAPRSTCRQSPPASGSWCCSRCKRRSRRSSVAGAVVEAVVGAAVLAFTQGKERLELESLSVVLENVVGTWGLGNGMATTATATPATTATAPPRATCPSTKLPRRASQLPRACRTASAPAAGAAPGAGCASGAGARERVLRGRRGRRTRRVLVTDTRILAKDNIAEHRHKVDPHRRHRRRLELDL